MDALNHRPRILPILTIDDRRLVKTVRFGNPNYIGDPINALKIFNEKMVDEIIVLDISASRQSRRPNFTLLREMASECFSPLGYGGGLTSLQDARDAFTCGIEKVVLNSALRKGLQLIEEVAEVYGSQSVVAAIDFKKNFWGKLGAYGDSGTKLIHSDVVEYAKQLESAGAGELMVQSIDLDGTFKGLNREITRAIAAAVSIPVITAGGAKSLTDMLETIDATNASAAAAGSIFVYRGNDTRSILISYPTPEDLLS